MVQLSLLYRESMRYSAVETRRGTHGKEVTQVNGLEVDQTIQFHDWNGAQYAGRVKDILSLCDDFGDFYMVLLETNDGPAEFEIEGPSDLLIGELWDGSEVGL